MAATAHTCLYYKTVYILLLHALFSFVIMKMVYLSQNMLGNVNYTIVDCVWNVMAHAQKPDFIFRRNGRVHLNRRGRQFSRLLAADVCTSACRVCTARASLCSAVMWRLLVTHSILSFPLYLSSHASPCAITFQLDSTAYILFGKKVKLVGIIFNP